MDMDSDSLKTFRRVEQNDSTLTDLWIGNYHWLTNESGNFSSRLGSDFSRFGGYIKENTHLKKLHVVSDHTIIGLKITDRGFFEGLKRNSSIHQKSILMRLLLLMV